MTNNLKSNITPTWCPGCQDYIIFSSLQTALNNNNIETKDLVIVYDIGCVGNMADFLKVFGVHSLHGRSVPTAMGIKLARPELKVVVVAGDGGAYGEGISHLIAAARMNIDITVLVANNHLYSLTTGQTSPTTPKGSKTKSNPNGVISVPVNPVSLINTINPDAWVKHVSCDKPTEVTEAIEAALGHGGFDLLDIDQLCVSFGKQLI